MRCEGAITSGPRTSDPKSDLASKPAKGMRQDVGSKPKSAPRLRPIGKWLDEHIPCAAFKCSAWLSMTTSPPIGARQFRSVTSVSRSLTKLNFERRLGQAETLDSHNGTRLRRQRGAARGKPLRDQQNALTSVVPLRRASHGNSEVAGRATILPPLGA